MRTKPLLVTSPALRLAESCCRSQAGLCNADCTLQPVCWHSSQPNLGTAQQALILKMSKLLLIKLPAWAEGFYGRVAVTCSVGCGGTGGQEGHAEQKTESLSMSISSVLPLGMWQLGQQMRCRHPVGERDRWICVSFSASDIQLYTADNSPDFD